MISNQSLISYLNLIFYISFISIKVNINNKKGTVDSCTIHFHVCYGLSSFVETSRSKTSGKNTCYLNLKILKTLLSSSH
jgi:hypothetical protein